MLNLSKHDKLRMKVVLGFLIPSVSRGEASSLAKKSRSRADAVERSAGLRRLKKGAARDASASRCPCFAALWERQDWDARHPAPGGFRPAESKIARLSRDALWSGLHDQRSSGPSASGVVASDRPAFARRADR